VHVKLVQAWKKLMLEQAATVFEGVTRPTATKEATAEQAELFEQIGRLKMELEWIKKTSCRVPVSGSGLSSNPITRN
jgi:transposase